MASQWTRDPRGAVACVAALSESKSTYCLVYGLDSIIRRHNEDVVELWRTIAQLRKDLAWRDRVIEDHPDREWLKAGYTR